MHKCSEQLDFLGLVLTLFYFNTLRVRALKVLERLLSVFAGLSVCSLVTFAISSQLSCVGLLEFAQMMRLSGSANVIFKTNIVLLKKYRNRFRFQFRK